MNPEQSLAAGCIPAFRFYLQAPGPDFAVVDCCRIFNDDTGYQAWVEALAPWLEVVSCTVCSVGHSFGQWLGLSFAKVAAAKQNKAEPWSAAVNRLLANEPPDAFVPKAQTQTMLPGPVLFNISGSSLASPSLLCCILASFSFQDCSNLRRRLPRSQEVQVSRHKYTGLCRCVCVCLCACMMLSAGPADK